MSDTAPGFLKRMVFAATNLIIPAQTLLILYYFLARWLQGDQWPMVQTVGYILPWLFLPLVFLLPLAVWRRSSWLVGMTAVCLFFFVATYGRFFWPQFAPSPDGPTFTVMTYNSSLDKTRPMK